MRKKITWWQATLILVLLVAILLVPTFAPNNYIVSVGVTFLVFAALGTAWNIIGGYAAQVSLANASFVAIGAYTSFLLFIHFRITPWIGMFVGMAISVLAALLIGSVSFRLRGPFFALCTISFAEIMRLYLLFDKDFTKGAHGLVITYRGDSFLNLMFRRDNNFYYIMAVFLVLCMFISWRVQRTRIGYYLQAIKAEEDAAESLGIETHRIKMKAFLISAAMTSAIGTIYAFFLSYIDPATVSSLNLAIRIVSMVFVGGAGTLFGPIIGAALLIPLTEISNVLLGSTGSGLLLYGMCLMLVVIFRPGGVMSLFTGGNDSPFMKLLGKLRKGNNRKETVQ